MMQTTNSSPNAANSRPQPSSILVYGFGNPGRQDDGLGLLCAEALECWAEETQAAGLVFDGNYQLNAEDALTISSHDVVVFVDATKEAVERFAFRQLVPRATIAFSTHAMAPESVLALCGELYGVQPAAWLLTIRGYDWEPNAALTSAAQANLAAALDFLKTWLQNPVPA